MNDEFLTQRLPDVRPAFEKALQGKLHRIEYRQRRRTYAVASALVIGLLFSLLLTLPPVRAQMRWLLREIGGLKFVETENPREDWETIITQFTEDGTVPRPGSSSVISLSEVLNLYPELARSMPARIPEGFVSSDDMVISDESVVLFWLPVGVNIGDDLPYPWISLSIGWSQDLPHVVKPGLVQEVFVGNIPAAMWRQVFVENPRDPEECIYTLEWSKNGLRYSISWRALGLTQDDMFRFAESIPDAAELLQEFAPLLEAPLE